MGTVLFLGNSLAQLESLPRPVREAFEWAITELTRDPGEPPQSPEFGMETKALGGPLPLFRISVRLRSDDPGYRGIYHSDGADVLFVRFARRDSSTYKGLRKLSRLLDNQE